MGRLDDVSLDELIALKEQVHGGVPQERVLAAIGRKQGDSLYRLAERHGVVEKTIRNWLDRFEESPLHDAPFDERRPGRPAKLSDTQQSQFVEDMQQPPSELGYDREVWTSDLVARHIHSTYGVEYTDRHVRYLLNDADLS